MGPRKLGVSAMKNISRFHLVAENSGCFDVNNDIVYIVSANRAGDFDSYRLATRVDCAGHPIFFGPRYPSFDAAMAAAERLDNRPEVAG